MAATGVYRKDLFDYAVLAYLASHIPITLCVDGQAALPRSLYPTALVELVDEYAAFSGDPLMAASGRPAWFRGIVSIELTLQMAFFFVALLNWGCPSAWRRWLRLATLAYGVHTATTLVPILATFLAHDDFPTEAHKWATVAIYSPYLLMPLTMAWRAWAVAELPVSTAGKAGKAA